MFDAIIIGAGVAGISTALTLQANGNTFCLLSAKGISEKVEMAEEIRNYPGLPCITGKDFSLALEKQLAGAGIEIRPFKATGIYPIGEKFIVASETGETVEGRTVVLATGVQSIKSVEGEESFVGRGVSYCATCDGFLYKDKTIAVLCASKKYEDEVKHLSSFAKRVILFPLYKGVGEMAENVEIAYAMPKAVLGEKRIEKLLLKKEYNGRDELAVDGFFVLKDGVSPSLLIAGLEMEDGHVVVDKKMRTSIAGIYAVGDCTGRPYQYAKAVGEGNVSAFAIKEYCKEN